MVQMKVTAQGVLTWRSDENLEKIATESHTLKTELSICFPKMTRIYMDYFSRLLERVGILTTIELAEQTNHYLSKNMDLVRNSDYAEVLLSPWEEGDDHFCHTLWKEKVLPKNEECIRNLQW